MISLYFHHQTRFFGEKSHQNPQVAAGASAPPPSGHRRLRARLRVAPRPGALRGDHGRRDGAGGGDERSTTDGDAGWGGHSWSCGQSGCLAMG